MKYSIKVEQHFKAGHCVRLSDDKMEETHMHDWRVGVEIGRDSLDKNGFVVDFHWVQKQLTHITQSLSKKPFINDHADFKEINPTAENIAIYIYEQLKLILPSDLFIEELVLQEAPDCWAVIRK